MRNGLVAALLACTDSSLKPKARKFLDGLSTDELQFIAEFIGAGILESVCSWASSRRQLADRIAEFQRHRAGWPPSRDQDHKSILLLEYLCCSGLRSYPFLTGARAGNS